MNDDGINIERIEQMRDLPLGDRTAVFVLGPDRGRIFARQPRATTFSEVISLRPVAKMSLNAASNCTPSDGRRPRRVNRSAASRGAFRATLRQPFFKLSRARATNWRRRD